MENFRLKTFNPNSFVRIDQNGKEIQTTLNKKDMIPNRKFMKVFQITVMSISLIGILLTFASIIYVIANPDMFWGFLEKLVNTFK